MISAIIVAYNEAEKLKTCLKSIASFADEIIVVDLGSTDKTRKVATEFKAKIVPHKFVSHVELIRNFAIAQCSGDWILVLDPDEQIPGTLKKFLRNFIQKNTSGILNIPRMNIFLGQWINHTNFWPDYQIRFFSKGTVKWKKLLHSYPTTRIPDIKLPLQKKYAIKHITYPSFSSFLKRQDRYSSIRAKERYANGERFSFWSLLYFPIREFLSRYIKHKGFLDKKRGLLLMVGLLYYHWAVEWKLKALKK